MSIVARKICLIGEFGVGKTSLIRQFVDRQFSDQYLSTVGVNISRKMVESEDSDHAVQLMIWDLEGRNGFRAIASSYLQGAMGAILVCDVTRPTTLQSLPEHIQQFLSINPNGKVIIAINKADLATSEEVEAMLRFPLLAEISAIIATYPTSAKNGKNVDLMFQTLSVAIAP
jgi:small GTP-binding protein